jgi:hypothetical protein
MKPQESPRSSELDQTLPTTEKRSPSDAPAKKPPSRWRSTLTHLKTEISLDHADIPIIACCLVSGLCDSSAYNAWTCFVSMQTGRSFLRLPQVND